MGRDYTEAIILRSIRSTVVWTSTAGTANKKKRKKKWNSWIDRFKTCLARIIGTQVIQYFNYPVIVDSGYHDKVFRRNWTLSIFMIVSIQTWNWKISPPLSTHHQPRNICVILIMLSLILSLFRNRMAIELFEIPENGSQNGRKRKRRIMTIGRN